MKTSLGLTLTSLLLLTTAASAEAGAKVHITVPKGWHQKQDGDVLIISAPSDEMNVVFVVMEQNEADRAFKKMDRAVEQAVGEVDWDHDGNAVEEEINGMPPLSGTDRRRRAASTSTSSRSTHRRTRTSASTGSRPPRPRRSTRPTSRRSSRG